MRAKAISALLALSLMASALLALGRDDSGFPHRKHAGLFPTCVGCHRGAITGSTADLFPAPQSCNGCHDGTDVKRVSWSGPEDEPSNLRFSHVEHAREMGISTDSAALSCQSCHRDAEPAPRDSAFMAVSEARPALCIDCHAHAAPSHLAQEAECATCHVTLAQATALPASEIATFPKPPSHERADFLGAHGTLDMASCAFCHARESCARCHPNASSVQSIAALPPDARVARLVADRPGEFPVPASHRESDFAYDHGALARAEIQRCANCHAQPSCRSCHIGTGAQKTIARLPKGERGATGVILRSRARDVSSAEPASLAPGMMRATAAVWPDTAKRPLGERLTSVHPPGFLTGHGAAAATKQLTCEGCHAKRFCADCHDGTARRRFHLANFVQRHAAEAFGRERDCSTCHNPQAFCKGCHENIGLASSGRRDVAFHSAQPLWLLQHGRAARQGLESCASCHAQRDCLQCHSTIGRGVNPHGSEFDAKKMANRNSGICFACHLSDPLAR